MNDETEYESTIQLAWTSQQPNTATVNLPFLHTVQYGGPVSTISHDSIGDEIALKMTSDEFSDLVNGAGDFS